MLEFVKGCLDIFGHGDVAGACSIVPVNGEYAEEGTGPVDGDGVQFLEGLDEVVGVFLADVIDPKVVNDEGENDGLGGVLPERRGSGNRGKSKEGKVRFEPVVPSSSALSPVAISLSVSLQPLTSRHTTALYHRAQPPSPTRRTSQCRH